MNQSIIPAHFCGCHVCQPPQEYFNKPHGTVTGTGYYGTSVWKHGGDGPLKLGMELEVVPSVRAWTTAVGYLGDGLAQVKPDGRLLETASHPMSLQYFMDTYPWDMLPALKKVRCVDDGARAGIHIHTSKAAFGGSDHIYRWFLFHYIQPNRENLFRLGGRPVNTHLTHMPATQAMRSLADYVAAAQDLQRARHKAVENARRSRGVLYLRDADKAAVAEMWEKHEAVRDASWHYRIGGAINVLRHTDTFETRFPASTLRPEQAQAMVQLADAGVEFAREASGGEGGLVFPAFREWVKGKPGYTVLGEIMKEKLGAA